MRLVADLKKETAVSACAMRGRKRLEKLEMVLTGTRAQLEICNGLLARAEEGVWLAETQRAIKVSRIAELEKCVSEMDAKLAMAVQDAKDAINDVKQSVAHEAKARSDVCKLTKEVEELKKQWASGCDASEMAKTCSHCRGEDYFLGGQFACVLHQFAYSCA